MKTRQLIREAALRLSPRERLLIGAALAISFVLVSIYGVMLPGQAAARSALDRNARASANLAEARALAANLGAALGVSETSLADLVASASARGLTVLDARITDGAAVLKLGSPGSVDVLAWAAEAADAATLTSLSITSSREGGVAADASFGGVS
jgi:hypothetical protein